MQPAHKAQPSRGSLTTFRGRGRGRGSSSPSATSSQHSHGHSSRGGQTQVFRGSRGRGSTQGRGSLSKRFTPQTVTATLPVLPIDIAPEAIKPHNPEKIAVRREKLKEQYESFREAAIKNGLMSDDTQSSIDDAIKTRGTCTQMCDEKERVERIYNGSVASEEMLPSPETGRMATIEGRMVKAFRRSAAGVDKQIPEELRTPRTLRRTLDYLFTNIIGSSDHLGKHHKFVWDRTRAVRNDFSIQSFTKAEDVKYEVDCYERIVRFHILSLHQLSDPDQLHAGEEYSRQQELQQLQKTFASLMDKYDTFGHSIFFRNEAEFRAYFILFAARTDLYDFEVQIQRWPKHVLNDGRVQTALKLNAAAGSTDYQVGSRSLEPIPCSVAQADAGLYWTLMASRQVGYLMACVAEISFQLVRFTALDSLWRAAKGAPEKGQSTMRNWTKQAMTEYLGFDDESQTEEFCAQFNVSFATHASTGQEHLDFRSNAETSLDRPKFNPEEETSQIFSWIVEQKRHGRSFVAVLNGMSIAQAMHAGMVTEEEGDGHDNSSPVYNSMFVQDDEEDEQQAEQSEFSTAPQSFTTFNPQADLFVPQTDSTVSKTSEPSWMTSFGQGRSSSLLSPDGPPKGLFGQQKEQPAATTASSSVPGQQKSRVSDNPRPFFIQNAVTNAEHSSSSLAPATKQYNSYTDFTSASHQAAQKMRNAPNETVAANPSILTASSDYITPQAFKPISDFSDTQPKRSIQDQASHQPIFDTFKPPSETASAAKFQFFPTEISKSVTGTSEPVVPGSEKPFDFGFASTKQPPSLPKPHFSESTLENTSAAPSSTASNDKTKDNLSGQDTPLLSSTKRPSLGDISFPAFLAPNAQPSSSPPINSLTTQNNSWANLKTQHTLPVASQNHRGTTTEQEHLVVATSSVQEPQPEPVDQDKLLEHLCRIGLVQKDGILDMFVSLQVSKIVQNVFRSFQERRFTQKTSALKTRTLSRKFFGLWRSIVFQRRMRRRAEKRRKMLVASVRKEQERKKQEETDLAEIIEAERITKQLQEEQRQRKEAERGQDKANKHSTESSGEIPAQQVGMKRKALAHRSSRSDIQGISMSPLHKRSKTIEPGAGHGSSDRNPPPSTKSPRTSLSASPDLRRSVSQKSLRQSLTQQRLDQTHTDYFRLKAIGVDPDTPFIPDTAASLAAKKQKEAENQAEALRRITARPSSVLDRSRTSTPTSSTGERQSPSIPRSTSILQTTERVSKAHVPTVGEDPFLKSLREARAAMDQDAEWFKSQTTELEKEIEQHEDFRRSQGSNSSREESFVASTNGFARSSSGYEYVPPDLRPGQTLSKTEERIRRTGARGLANKPIGGTPTSSPKPDYAPVAMSRRTASALRHSQNAYQDTNGGIHNRKRSFDEVHVTNDYNNSDRYHQYSSPDLTQQAMKKARNKITLQGLQNIQQNPFDRRHEQFVKDQEDDEDEEEEYVDEEEEVAQNGIFNNKAGIEREYEGYYEENADDAEDEEELDEDEVEEDVEGVQYRPSQYTKPNYDWKEASEDYGTEDEDESASNSGYGAKYSVLHHGRGSQAVSAAATPETGLGSTVNDAIELSD